MFKLHGCWLLYFGTALARNLGDCQIFDMYSNNILDLLGLTNLGTKCEDVVCKYEQVRELRFETAISFCILHFASCIFQNLPVAKTYFSKRIHKVELQLWYVGKSKIRVYIPAMVCFPRVYPMLDQGWLETSVSSVHYGAYWQGLL